MLDKLAHTDTIEAGITTDAVPPEYPCPICSKATKDNNTDEDREAGKNIRICSNRNCRARVDWSSNEPVLQT